MFCQVGNSRNYQIQLGFIICCLEKRKSFVYTSTDNLGSRVCHQNLQRYSSTVKRFWQDDCSIACGGLQCVSDFSLRLFCWALQSWQAGFFLCFKDRLKQNQSKMICKVPQCYQLPWMLKGILNLVRGKVFQNVFTMLFLSFQSLKLRCLNYKS